MEGSAEPSSLKWPPPQPLPSRLFGILSLVFLLFSAVAGVAVFHFPFLVFQLVWPKFWAVYSEASIDTWFRFYLFYLERTLGVRFVVTGDQIRPDEDLLLISNHPSEADWLYFWSFASRWHFAGSVKVILKDALRKVPGIGWVIDNMGYIFLSRDWKKDKAQLLWSCQKLLACPTRFFLCIFPEGTDFAPHKLKKSLEFARKNGISYDYKHVLVPRTKGFCYVLRQLRPRVESLYDFTFGYEGGVTPTVWTAWSGWFPRVIHVHVRRHAIEGIPAEKEAASKWCYQVFEEKDRLLRQFKLDGKFPEGKRPEWKEPRGLAICAAIWIPCTLFFGFFLYTNLWFRLYMGTAWTFYLLSSLLDPFRVLRGLQPPPGFLERAKPKKD